MVLAREVGTETFILDNRPLILERRNAHQRLGPSQVFARVVQLIPALKLDFHVASSLTWNGQAIGTVDSLSSLDHS